MPDRGLGGWFGLQAANFFFDPPIFGLKTAKNKSKRFFIGCTLCISYDKVDEAENSGANLQV
jgi:hypothetical protein